MSTAPSIEDRLCALEQQMAELRRELACKRLDENWIAKISGRFKDDPVFDEIVPLGAEIRDAEPPPDDES